MEDETEIVEILENPMEEPSGAEPQSGSEILEDEVIVHEISEEEFLALFSADQEDLSGYRTISLTRLALPEDEQSGAVSSVMAEVIESVLGEYQRRTYTVEQYDTEGNLIGTSTEYVPGLAGLDYAWITGAILFGVFISGIFKLLGGLMRS